MITKPPARYLEAVDELAADPIVKRMAARLADVPGEQRVHADGTLDYRFMCEVADDYIDAGGQHRGPVGAIAHAVLRLRAESALTEGDSRS
ncbi:hypothetical protein [Nonomuraea sp. CA-141351]|uniref:hypothetical protein n=1 Tax=Nonomuraea sp. CA-141351 TaxID=3239996 RepID=UPI003D8E9ABC